MIKITELPQQNDILKTSYETNGDVLRITLDGATEEFDFTGLPEGIADSIESEVLKINPIISAEKVGDEIIISLIRFYGEEEKEVFEFGENQVESTIGSGPGEEGQGEIQE